MATPMVYGHRGTPGREPENSLAGFELAGRIGADGVELDVRRTVDGELVVHHDPALADGRLLAATARAELPAGIPTLARALDVCAGADLVVNVELKNVPGEPDFDPTAQLADQVVDTLATRSGRDRVLISGFDLATVDRVRARAPRLATGFLTLLEPTPTEGLAMAAEHGHDAFHPYHAFVDEALVVGAHERGLALNTWTVDDLDRARQLAAWGVDGIVTNVPDAVARALR
ncbi:MAG: glycerophosphodiester phosphodiesterase [Acidimicrobiales bacterium]|nr:glycerophosphodiester phosphodiesterase [Acidimicrobiales bacterium]